MPGVCSCRLRDTREVLEQIAASLAMMLSVVHEVRWHHNLLLHHVIEGNH